MVVLTANTNFVGLTEGWGQNKKAQTTFSNNLDECHRKQEATKSRKRETQISIRQYLHILATLTKFLAKKFPENMNRNNANRSNIHVIKTTITRSRKRHSKHLFNSMFYAGRAFKWYHSQLYTMNISIGQNCLNKRPSWVYSSPPPLSRGVGTTSVIACV